jgi:hypothetical protein
MPKEKLEIFRQPRELLKGQSGSPTKKSQPPLFQGYGEEVSLLLMTMIM